MLALDILNKYKINKYKNLCSGIYLGDDYSDGVDSYSKDIEECDEAIKELEALENKFKVEQENNLSSEIAKTETILRLKKYIEALENRSCDGCKYHLGDNGNYPFAPCDKCSRFYSDCWESKC